MIKIDCFNKVLVNHVQFWTSKIDFKLYSGYLDPAQGVYK